MRGAVARLAAFSACAAVAVCAAPARAAVVFGEQPGTRAARIHHRWLAHLALPLPPGRVVVNLAPCPDVPQADGCSAPGVVWLSPSVADQALLLHELGHQLDYAQPGWARVRFERLSGDRRPWASEPNGAAEQFAEAWAGCAVPALAAQRYDSATGRYEFAYDYRPTWNVLRRTCRLIRQAASASVRRVSAPAAAASG